MFKNIFNFSTLWALSHLFHFQWGFLLHVQSDINLILIALAVSCSAIYFLLSGSVFSLVVLAVLQLLHASTDLPDITNHWLLVSFINLNIVVVYIYSNLKKKGDAYFWEIFSASVKLGVIAFYAWAFIWKLNSGFLAESSCANQFASLIMDLSPTLEVIVPYLTLIVEGLLPLLLLVKNTRLLGVILAVIFHGVLLLPIERFFLNFSFLMIPLVSLFVESTKNNNFQEDRNSRLFNFRNFCFLSFVLLFLVAIQGVNDWFYLRQFVALVLYLIIFYSLVRDIINFKTSSLNLGNPIVFLLPLIILINGLFPVLGYKTASSWQMYSNLEISDQGSNHFIVPKSLDLGGYLGDRVRVVSSPIMPVSQELPYLLLLRECFQGHCVGLNYERAGKIVSTNGDGETLEFNNLNIIQRKILRFRPFNQTEKDCVW